MWGGGGGIKNKTVTNNQDKFSLACQVTITLFVFSLPNADLFCRVSVSFGSTGSTVEKKTEVNKVLQLATPEKIQTFKLLKLFVFFLLNQNGMTFVALAL